MNPKARWSLLAVVSLASLLIVRCGPTYGANLHIWGVYATTVETLSSSCALISDGGCFPGSDAGSTFGQGQVTLGFLIDGGQAVVLRGTDSKVLGSQAGDRFVFNIAAPASGLVLCGCAANVNETLWGQFVPLSSAAQPDAGLDCAVDSGVCSVEIPACSPGDWLTHDGGINSNADYVSFDALAIDQFTAEDLDASCPCLPCTVTSRVTGHLTQ